MILDLLEKGLIRRRCRGRDRQRRPQPCVDLHVRPRDSKVSYWRGDVTQFVALGEHPRSSNTAGLQSSTASSSKHRCRWWQLERFRNAFNEAVSSRVSERDLAGVILTDGELAGVDLEIDNARAIAAYGPWGQGFEEPLFHGEFDVVMQRVVGERHLKLALKRDGRVADAIAFNQEPVTGSRVSVVYRLGVNDYGPNDTLQLQVEELEIC